MTRPNSDAAWAAEHGITRGSEMTLARDHFPRLALFAGFLAMAQIVPQIWSVM